MSWYVLSPSSRHLQHNLETPSHNGIHKILFSQIRDFLKYFWIYGKPTWLIDGKHESTLTFSEFIFPKRWTIVKVSVKTLFFKHFVKVVCTLFVVSVVVDTASLSTGIGTDTENKGNIILGNVLNKTRNYHLFFNRFHNYKLTFSWRKSRKQFYLFEKVYTKTHTVTNWPKIMSHQPTLTHTNPK